MACTQVSVDLPLENDLQNDSTKTVSRTELYGLWYSAGYTVDYRAMGLFMDTDREFIQRPEYLYFDQDSLWTMIYPCRLISAHTYQPDNWHLANNVLSIGGERTYKQMDFDSTVINQIIKDKFIPACYSGEWHLVKSESGGDGTGVDYIFPFDIQDTLIIDEASISLDNIENGIIELHIGGKLRPFHFSFSTSFYRSLSLRATDSWSEEDKRMWRAWWRDDDWSEDEIKALKQEEGVDLEIQFTKSAF